MKDDSTDTIEVMESREVSSENQGEKEYSRKGTKLKPWLNKPRQSQAMKHAMIAKLKLEGVPANQIAEAVSMPPNTVRSVIERFKPFFNEVENVREFKEAKSDILEACQITALKSAFDEKKLKKSSFLATVSGVEKLQRMQRLHDDQSTSNTAIVFGGIGNSEKE